MTSTTNEESHNRIQRKLDELRAAIGRYVWWQGIALAIAWLGLSFWIALGLDYLPVSLGLSEMPWQARAVLLAVMLLVLGWIVYRWILRRAFVRFSDRNLALLLERRYDQFEDGLVTSVEFSKSQHSKSQPGDSSEKSHVSLERLGGDLQTVEQHPVDQNMVDQTTRQVVDRIDDVQVRDVLNRKPIVRATIAATFALGSLLSFVMLSHGSSLLAARRLFLLKDDPWPRMAHVEVVGIRIKRDEPLPGLSGTLVVIPFVDGRVRVARGSNVELIARADADLENNPQRSVPRYCTIYYRTHGYQGGGQSRGESEVNRSQADQYGRQDMNKIGRAENGWQRYTLNQQPLKGIQSTLEFNLRGGDHRIGGFEIEVVDPPTVTATRLNCRFPDYMVDESSGSWTPRTIRLTAGTQLPVGTQATMNFSANKPLRAAYIHNPTTGQTATVQLSAGRDAFTFNPGEIEKEVLLDVTLEDRDGVFSESAQRVYIGAVEDKSPRVSVRIDGIGTAITPNARVPFLGEIVDEYAVARAWVEFGIGGELSGEPSGGPGQEQGQNGDQTDGTTPAAGNSDPESRNAVLREMQIELAADGKVDTAIDFEALSQQAEAPLRLSAGKDQTVSLLVRAVDRFNLTGEPNMGVGDRYNLDVVSPEEMSRILERLEVGQRRRLEQIQDEMRSANEYLIRARLNSSGSAEPVDARSGDDKSEAADLSDEPGDKNSVDENQDRIDSRELNLLYSQRALLQVRKSKQEVLGVSTAFLNIRDQLVNNRLDRKDRRSRLESDIAAPLQQIANLSMTELESQIKDLEVKLKQVATLAGNLTQEDELVAEDDASQLADVAIQQSALVISEIDAVLKILIKYESYSELLEVVRKMQEDQQRLLEETKRQRKKQQIGDLLD